MAVETSRLVIEIDAKNAEKQTLALSDALQDVTNNGNKADKSSNVLSASLKSLAGYMAGIVTVSQAIEKMDAYSGINNRLKLVTSSQKDLNTAMGDTFAIAQKSYQSWDSVVQVYQRFSDNAKTLGINMQQTARLTETVSKAVAISGASTQAAEAALTQFVQALASGTLRGEELNSVMEQTPALAKAIAQGMGITVGQLRSVAAEGKITSDVLVKALTKVSSSVDEQFAKTDITIGQSVQLLSNELTKFVGEAGKSSGAATLLAESIKTLSLNLSLIADASVVVGIGYITKAIATKTAATYADVAASNAQRQASIAVAAAEVKEAQAHLANIQATNAQAQAKWGATAANARYKLASDAVTAALTKQAIAQGALNTTTSIGSKALGLVGGPIGVITIGVSALAAGYMYMQSRAEKANQELERQAQVANKAEEELKALNGIEKDKSVNDLTTALKAQNEALKESSSTINMQLKAIKQLYAGNAEVVKVVDDATNGTISMTEATARFNKLRISKEIYESFKKNAEVLVENTEKATLTQRALKYLGVEVGITGKAAQNAVNGINSNSNALDDNASAAKNAAKAQQDYIKSVLQSAKQARITNTLIAKGYSNEDAKDLAEVAAKNGKVTVEEAKAIMFKNKEVAKLNATLEAQRKAEQEANRSSRKATSDRTKQENKERREADKYAKESYDLRVQYQLEYADRVKKSQLELERELQEIQKAFGSDPTRLKEYTDAAKARNKASNDLYEKELALELYGFKLNEEEKLTAYKNLNIERINATKEYTEEEKKIRKNAILAQYQLEISNAQLAKDQRIFQYTQGLMKESDAIHERYELERREIMKTIDVEERQRKLNASYQLEEIDQQERRRGVDTRFKERFNIDQKTPYQEDLELLKQALEEKLITEEEYFQRRLQLQAGYGAQYGASFAGMLKGLVDENSNAYALLASTQKAFTIFSTALASYDAISKAWASAPFPYNLPAVATATMETGLLQAAVSALSPAGFKTGGYTGNMGVNDVAGVVHGQEYVFDAKSTSRVGTDTLDAIRSGKPVSVNGGSQQSNVNVPITIVNQFDDGTIAEATTGEAGQKAFMNNLKRNKSQVKAVLGLA